jgi:hypothetical protein
MGTFLLVKLFQVVFEGSVAATEKKLEPSRTKLEKTAACGCVQFATGCDYGSLNFQK